jgi:hypothetical protein
MCWETELLMLPSSLQDPAGLDPHSHNYRCIQPSLAGLEIRYLGRPNTEVLGYYRPSLREQNEANCFGPSVLASFAPGTTDRSQYYFSVGKPSC